MEVKTVINQIRRDNKELFTVSRSNARKFFESNPSKEDLVQHFVGRMVNERMNMTEISAQVAAMPSNACPEELELLTKQAMDEAIHFRLVKEVVEHVSGKAVDVEAEMASEAAANTEDGAFAKGASLLGKYDAQNDEVALALYQMIAEGRAEAVWDEMSKCINDEFVSSRYSRIAKDEGFHAAIGERKLAKLIEADSSVIGRVKTLAPQMRADLLHISNENTKVM